MLRPALVAAILLSGCVAELLEDDPATSRNFACLALAAPQVAFVVSVTEAGDSLPFQGGVEVLAATLQDVVARPPESFRTVVKRAAVPDLQAWADDLDQVTRTEIRMYLVVVPTLPADGDTFLRLRPAVYAVSGEAVRAGAATAGLSVEQAATGVFLHMAGHALGAVNRGIPMASSNITDREGPMHHEPDRSSVLHMGWHHRSSLPNSQTATLAYSDAVKGDWAAAVTGVCA